MRSRTGCMTCRGRKLKCDEQKPTCGQCQKANRQCKPSDSIVFRHQQNASMNSSGTNPASSRNLDSFYAYKNTFDGDNVWLEIPKRITFVNILDPYATPPTPDLEERLQDPETSPYELHREDWEMEHDYHSTDAQTRGLEALSAAALFIPPEANMLPPSIDYPENNFQNSHSPHGERENLTTPLTPQTPITSSNRNLDFILNPSSAMSPQIDPNLQPPDVSAGDEYLRRSPNEWHLQPRVGTEICTKVAFLLRHFSEVTGQWMDLFDQATYFGSHIPVKAITNPLLKHAACAYAAKQLGRVNGTKPIVGGPCSKQASMEGWDGPENEDFALVAARHYENAISLLMEALNWDRGTSEANSSEEIDKRQYAPRTLEGMVAERRLRRRLFGSAQSTAGSDDLLAATTILCGYEYLDASNAAWARHLSGTKSLLDVVEVGIMPLESPTTSGPFSASRNARKPSQARKAIFWEFARQDFVAAFINECRTRLDTDDIAMWKEAGLLLDENNLVIPSNSTDRGISEDGLMREDMIGNALVWLSSKLMNFICAGEQLQPAPVGLGQENERPEQMTSMGISQQSLLARWNQLKNEMDIWFNGLPETFMPTAIIPANPYGCDLTEVWHTIPVCAATILSWHMAQVLLLINKPHETTARRSTVAGRLKSYRTIQEEIVFHSRQIVAICLGRPQASVRIHSLQPLFVAGQCLTDTGERRVILDLLRRIEADTGVATDYRVQQLLKEWGWENEEDLGGG